MFKILLRSQSQNFSKIFSKFATFPSFPQVIENLFSKTHLYTHFPQNLQNVPKIIILLFLQIIPKFS